MPGRTRTPTSGLTSCVGCPAFANDPVHTGAGNLPRSPHPDRSAAEQVINNQHKSPNRAHDWWSTTFRHCIEQIGTVLVVLAPWTDPIPLQRACKGPNCAGWPIGGPTAPCGPPPRARVCPGPGVRPSWSTVP